ncbi:glycosyltransferase family 2 protein [Clostridium botulinum]|nr:glycosyltransferase family 2 protein [Clostridium botulinum]
MEDLIIISHKEQLDRLKLSIDENIRAITIDDMQVNDNVELIDKSPCVINSYKVYRWLIEQRELPKKIYFLDEGALGYFTIQAQNVLNLFKKVEFTILQIGKTIDKYKVNDQWSLGKVYDLKLSYMENYVVKNKNDEKEKTINPSVSVCISHFNHGKYLPETLEALSNNTYRNFEVIIVDSESNDPYSIEVFGNMENKYRDRFKFYHRKNESLGETRNHAVESANGDYIIFFDSDNIPKPDMIETYVKGMKTSKCDCLTAHNLQFEDGMRDLLFTPIGPALAYGIFENCFGDSAFCIKKEVFKKLNGFTTDRLGLEDWEFLAKLSLEGYKQDVIPVPIYRYRRNNHSMANTVNNYKSHNRILRSYTENQPKYIKELLTEFCLPVYKNGYKQYEDIDETSNPVEGVYMSGILIKIIKVIKNIIPRKSNIYDFLKRKIKG